MYNHGNIIHSEYVGGICGSYVCAFSGNCTITNSYNTGDISNNSLMLGGFVVLML